MSTATTTTFVMHTPAVVPSRAAVQDYDRRQIEHAYTRGVAARRSKRHGNPFHGGSQRRAWFAGWRDEGYRLGKFDLHGLV